MFDIAWSELLLIAIVALIFIGPKELPQVMYKLAQGIGKLRNQADEFRRQFEESAREAGFQDLQKNLQDFKQLNPANQLKDSIDRALSTDQTNTIAAPQPTEHPAQISSEIASQGEAGKVVSHLDATKSETDRVADAAFWEASPASGSVPVPSVHSHHDGLNPAPVANGAIVDRPRTVA